jgi:hypothetical protein
MVFQTGDQEKSVGDRVEMLRELRALGCKLLASQASAGKLASREVARS